MTSNNQPTTQQRRPRLAASADYLRSASDVALSAHSRFRCAFESIYFVLCELAEAAGITFERVEHSGDAIVSAGMDALAATVAERQVVEQLVHWAVSTSPFVPEAPSIEEACAVAHALLARATDVLSPTSPGRDA